MSCVHGDVWNPEPNGSDLVTSRHYKSDDVCKAGAIRNMGDGHAERDDDTSSESPLPRFVLRAF